MAFRSLPYLTGFIHLIVGVMIAGLTIACHFGGLRFETPWSIASFVIVFPMVFAINNAMHRRESANMHFANVRSGIIEFFLTVREATAHTMHRLQDGDHKKNDDYEDDCDGELTHDALMKHVRAEVFELVDLLLAFLKTANRHNTKQSNDIYAKLGELFRLLEFMRPSIETGLLSRIQQYLYHAHTAFERMRVYKEYGTPYSMRTLMYLAMLMFPFMYAPYFAHMAQAIDLSLASSGSDNTRDVKVSNQHFTAGLCIAVGFAVVISWLLAALLCIVDVLESVFTPIDLGLVGDGDHISVVLPLMQMKASMTLYSEWTATDFYTVRPVTVRETEDDVVLMRSLSVRKEGWTPESVKGQSHHSRNSIFNPP